MAAEVELEALCVSAHTPVRVQMRLDDGALSRDGAPLALEASMPCADGQHSLCLYQPHTSPTAALPRFVPLPPPFEDWLVHPSAVVLLVDDAANEACANWDDALWHATLAARWASTPHVPTHAAAAAMSALVCFGGAPKSKAKAAPRKAAPSSSKAKKRQREEDSEEEEEEEEAEASSDSDSEREAEEARPQRRTGKGRKGDEEAEEDVVDDPPDGGDEVGVGDDRDE
jgi:hypothetical protein